MVELHTYIKCSKCGEMIRASKHTPEQCEGFRKFGKPTTSEVNE